MKISVNKPCPCGSKEKYKNCCQKYHKGAKPKNALLLMKSRYSAYVFADSKYIMITTHPDNPDYSSDKIAWKESIETFSKKTNFLSLEIDSFEEETNTAFVTFKAHFSEGELYEKSRFIKEKSTWLYIDGEFI